MCAKFLQYRDGGKTDEKGISTHLYGLFTGEVINGMAVSQNSPLGMSVLVSEGRVMIDSGSDYPYLGFTDANEVVTITTADGSNPRIDAIVAYIDLSVVDSTNANNPGAFKIVAVAGTPAGSPSAPNNSAISTAIGSGNPFIRLANVTVGTGVTTITTGNVSDQRVMANVADGLVDTNSLATEAVETAKIKDGAVTGSKITNYKIVRQNDTTNSTETTSRILTGWGVVTNAINNTQSESVTFNSAFSSAPIVIVTCAGDKATNDGYGSGGVNLANGIIPRANAITTTGFNVTLNKADGTNFASGYTWYTWIAVGV